MDILEITNVQKNEIELYNQLCDLTMELYKLLKEEKQKDNLDEKLSEKITKILADRQEVIRKIEKSRDYLQEKYDISSFADSKLKDNSSADLYDEIIANNNAIKDIMMDIKVVDEKANALMQEIFLKLKDKLTNVRENKKAHKAYTYENLSTDGWFFDQKK
ncbi:hypothetical protein SYNTR_1802 [Candidatus Syntrophocurvum alkaliphilum]|uniref:FlgN protein n=1 Tax=Candidatus Syntrophocurvum alkaliphilum TaxID=2293317 RepID=A0A6I6DE61_9FIRM|nr:hypothetical protein [Candidatus Syntrophocurvum alkaliphilum]QGU00396.1 hypothetical protein SYNTR_1802 [Candidatus Syntrophocurvum alkaliphilum]